MPSPNETAVLRHVLEMAQANKHRLARVMGISPDYCGTMLGSLLRRGLLAMGQGAPGSKYDVYKLTPSGCDELLTLLGALRRKEAEKAEQATVNAARLDRTIDQYGALIAQQSLIPAEAMEEGVL